MKTSLTDRERILSIVINRLMSSQLLNRSGDVHNEASWRDHHGDMTYAHFAYYRKPVKGDLVIGRTGWIGGPHEYSVGFYDSALSDGAVIREIGSERLCNYTNEEFTVIAGIHPSQLLEGDQYRFSQKAQVAFWKADEYSYRFGGIEFLGKWRAKVWVREAFGGAFGESVPFAVEMDFNRKTSVKNIVALMRAGGLGTKSFRPGKVETKR